MIRPQLEFADLWSRENLDERTIHSPVVDATGEVWWPGAQQETPDSGSTPLCPLLLGPGASWPYRKRKEKELQN